MNIVVIGSIGKQAEKMGEITRREEEKGNRVWDCIKAGHLNEVDMRAEEGTDKAYSLNPSLHKKETLEEIRKADKVIVCLPSGNGTHFELGFAFALGKQIELVGDYDASENCFYESIEDQKP